MAPVGECDYYPPMCTVVILRRPGDDWPLLVATNRDEMTDRAWSPPARHWPDRPGTVAGRDDLAGGTWLGLNEAGVVAGILNRIDTLGPSPDFRSRGALPLLALDQATAAEAAGAVAGIEAARYRPFNMIVADARAAFWLRSAGGGGPVEAPVETMAVPEGLSMITAHDLNDPASARISHYLPRFRAAAPPEPEKGDWGAWESLMADRQGGARGHFRGAMRVVSDFGFATVSSSLIALPGAATGAPGPLWRFAAGPPGEAPYETLTI